MNLNKLKLTLEVTALKCKVQCINSALNKLQYNIIALNVNGERLKVQNRALISVQVIVAMCGYASIQI